MQNVFPLCYPHMLFDQKCHVKPDKILIEITQYPVYILSIVLFIDHQ